MSLQNTSPNGHTYTVPGGIREPAYRFVSRNQVAPIIETKKLEPGDYNIAHADAAKLEQTWLREPKP